MYTYIHILIQSNHVCIRISIHMTGLRDMLSEHVAYEHFCLGGSAPAVSLVRSCVRTACCCGYSNELVTDV